MDFGFIVMLNIFGCVLHLLNVILQSRVTQLLILRDLDLYEKRHKWDPSNGSGAGFFVISLVVVGVLLCATFEVRCGIFATSLILLILLLILFLLLCGIFMTCSSSTRWYHVVRWIQSMFTIELQQMKKKHVKQKNIPFFWAFLMHIISTEIFLDLGQFFLRPWIKNKKPLSWNVVHV